MQQPLYNRAMRAVTLLLLVGLMAGPVLAQNSAPPSAPDTKAEGSSLSREERQEGRRNQRTQRIEVEDGGSRVQELRIGGQTQTITVQPKTGNMPEYEVQPSDGGVRNRSRSDGNDTNGARVWNVLKF